MSNTTELLWQAARVGHKRALPILSFPAAQALGVPMDELVRSAQLQARTHTVRDMEKKRAEEASWCDGYEAGLREGMQSAMKGVTIGDVVTLTRLRNARRVHSVNE